MRTWLLTACVIVILGASDACAQSRRSTPRYSSPSGRPTVSPYLNLFRPFPAGGVPNYYTLVRPQLDQLQVNRQQSNELEQQSANLNQLQRQSLGVRGVNARPTGVGAGFMTHSQFYDTRR